MKKIILALIGLIGLLIANTAFASRTETEVINFSNDVYVCTKLFLSNGIAVTAFTTDTNLANNSTSAIPTESAVVGYTAKNINALSNFVINTSFSVYNIPYAVSNNINLTNGGWQYYAPTNTTTIYMPYASTNMGHSLRLDIFCGTNSFTIATNGFCVVKMGSAYVTNSGVGTLIFTKAYNWTNWSVYTMP